MLLIEIAQTQPDSSKIKEINAHSDKLIEELLSKINSKHSLTKNM